MSPEVGVGSERTVSTAAPSVIPELTEEEAVDKVYMDDGKGSLFSEVSETGDKANDSSKDLLKRGDAAALAQSKTSTALGDVFSVVFDPKEDIHNFWSTFRFLQHSPRKVLFDTSMLDVFDPRSRGGAHLSSLSRPPTAGGALLPPRPTTRHSRSRPPLEVLVDGPHGAPSSAIFAAEHAVLVATGIGVTPFASILQSIMHK